MLTENISVPMHMCDKLHEKEIVAICKTDQMLICEDCLKTLHLKHDRMFICTLAKNLLAYAQKVLNTADDAIQNFVCINSSINKENVISMLKGKLSDKFDDLITKLMDYKEKILKDIESLDIVNDIDTETQELCDQEKSLKDLQNDIENTRIELQKLIDDKNYIGTLGMKQRFVQYESAIGLLSKSINNCTVKLQEGMDNAEKLADNIINSDFHIEDLIDMRLLKSLNTPSKKKSPIKSPGRLLNSSITPEMESTVLNQELPNLLVKIENTHGKEITLYSISSGTFNNLRFSKDFKVPFNFALIEHQYESMLYITGGWLANKYRGNTYEYNLVTGKITKKSLMKIPRRSHAGVFCTSPIVCGGENMEGHLNSCELFDYSRNEWVAISSLNEKKSYCTAVNFNNSQIYIFGGYTYINGVQKQFDTIECLDLTIEKFPSWTIVKLAKKSSWNERQDVGAIQISKNEILLFGGYVTNSKIDTLIFNTETRIMDQVCDLPKENRFYQRVPKIINNCVYVMGGETENIFVFDIGLCKWQKIID